MRKIKFRAWDKYNKCMCRVDYMDWDGGIVGLRNSDNEDHESTLDYVNLLQYTGLKDINGVEIYEGDIVKETLKLERGKKQESFYEVNFGNGMFRYKQPLVYGYEYLEVVGNIYENKEILQ